MRSPGRNTVLSLVFAFPAVVFFGARIPVTAQLEVVESTVIEDTELLPPLDEPFPDMQEPSVRQIPDFGTSVTFFRDLDGDSIPDMVVGSPVDDDGGEDRGAIWILFLNEDKTLREFQKISDTEGGFEGGLRNRDRFGSSVAALGDEEEAR